MDREYHSTHSHFQLINSSLYIKHKNDIQQYIMSSVIKRMEQRRFLDKTKRFQYHYATLGRRCGTV